jgi:integrase
MMSDKSDYLFLNKYGEPYYSSSKISYTYWKPVLKKLNLPYRKMYLMRHTFISLMISRGEDILWVSKIVGHKDVSITFKEYARYIDDGTKQRATFLQDVA